MMSILDNHLAVLGILFLLGLITDVIGRKTHLPRVTLLLVFGLTVGPSGLALLPSFTQDWFPLVTNIALLMVGFLLGEKLAGRFLKENGREILIISSIVTLITAVIVFIGMWLLNTGLIFALLVAGVATATDPAAVSEVVKELKTKGKTTQVLLGIVAIDDAWGLLLFSFILVLCQSVSGNPQILDIIMHALWDLGGAFVIGALLGIPMAFLTGRIKSGEPTLIEALGMVFLCGGIAQWLNVSYLLTAIVMGVTVANLAYHHTRPFHAIEEIEWPFMVLFFILAGASFDVSELANIGVFGVAYLTLRVIGRLMGSWLGGKPFTLGTQQSMWVGLSLLPQAGVALGLALLAKQHFSEIGESLLQLTIAGTIVFEIIGPIFTRIGISRLYKSG
ncbi:cation:proton antiporter [Endozoicomonas sp. SM1973]|uniref:Cation:proton antiporter n=1 Tax=Spartinivicinus marinus TaxID=2994442 RepID=A0A853I5Q5_9GAMM|nr:cation:proton antiporter [Spartinivicinus marinus]MCX4025287.1 cation:proton antiporter [Spartinivicinus marinus]NYZ66008.1 cation:proton antiporter [Spartinivicinus marinus]